MEYTQILVDVDYVTKWVEAIPTSSVDHNTSIKMLKEVIFPSFGVPRYLMTDGGSHFIHGAFRKMLVKYDVNHRIAHKVLQSGFYWPTLFKDARKFVLSCDECQTIGNISRRQEMPMNYSFVIEPFDVWGFDDMGPFPSLMGTYIF